MLKFIYSTNDNIVFYCVYELKSKHYLYNVERGGGENERGVGKAKNER